ncbi:MAG: ethanolamine utilization protein EutH [Ellagibacter isourolithinifaciens]|uniref:ethanolamine utilization protein EutH n=1 Tax=Ellagibacter isourolithinifaciens TaxID=2137581 RepID=UPI0023F35A03|nr:ethanolamine utilization protein EutH [Ellagibacter isourolithinifaciens]MDD7689488.1 ethanolamine utilization protein EutH [Ellagibacter isourolithinifaciens]MDY4122396.1 ethanolamine utilization protein EutH [Ellagibacter isourolithinifaciens]
MELIGTIVVYIIMACAIAGCLASVIKPESELGQQFVAGIDSIGPIFLPVAGIMASAPYLTAFVSAVFGPAYSAVGADPAMAATTFIAVDMGGYQLADALAETRESWIMAMVTGYMAGATIVFSIPVALKMLEKRDRKYLALGVMSGLLAIPIGVLVASAIIAVSHPMVREIVSTNADATYQLALSWGQIGVNLIPLIIICVALAAGLKFKPDAMIKGFIVFGRVMESALKIVFVLVVVEYFTGVWSTLFGSFGFDPIIADEEDAFRALEVSGAIGMMLCGAFPMVYLIRRYLAKPLAKIGGAVGLSSDATAGLLAGSANVLALFSMVKDLRAKDKVICMAFAVCCAFLFGDHLSFTANFQPNLIVVVLAGKLAAGICAIVFAKLLAVKKAEQLEREAGEDVLYDAEHAVESVE